jgi:hypothetical protein
MYRRIIAALFSIIVLFNTGFARATPPTEPLWLIGKWTGSMRGAGGTNDTVYTFRDTNGAIIWSRMINGFLPSSGQATVAGDKVLLKGSFLGYKLAIQLQRNGANGLVGVGYDGKEGRFHVKVTKQ